MSYARCVALIKDDVCTDAQQEVEKIRASHGPEWHSEAAALARWRKHSRRMGRRRCFVPRDWSPCPAFAKERLAPEQADIPRLEVEHKAKRASQAQAVREAYDASAAPTPPDLERVVAWLKRCVWPRMAKGLPPNYAFGVERLAPTE